MKFSLFVLMVIFTAQNTASSFFGLFGPPATTITRTTTERGLFRDLFQDSASNSESESREQFKQRPASRGGGIVNDIEQELSDIVVGIANDTENIIRNVALKTVNNTGEALQEYPNELISDLQNGFSTLADDTWSRFVTIIAVKDQFKNATFSTATVLLYLNQTQNATDALLMNISSDMDNILDELQNSLLKFESITEEETSDLIKELYNGVNGILTKTHNGVNDIIDDVKKTLGLLVTPIVSNVDVQINEIFSDAKTSLESQKRNAKSLLRTASFSYINITDNLSNACKLLVTNVTNDLITVLDASNLAIQTTLIDAGKGINELTTRTEWDITKLKQKLLNLLTIITNLNKNMANLVNYDLNNAQNFVNMSLQNYTQLATSITKNFENISSIINISPADISNMVVYLLPNSNKTRTMLLGAFQQLNQTIDNIHNTLQNIYINNINQTIENILHANLSNILNNTEDKLIKLNDEINKVVTTIWNEVDTVKDNITQLINSNKTTIYVTQLEQQISNKFVKVIESVNRFEKNITELLNGTGISTNTLTKKVNQSINSIIQTIKLINTNITHLINRTEFGHETSIRIDQLNQQVNITLGNLIANISDSLTKTGISIELEINLAKLNEPIRIVFEKLLPNLTLINATQIPQKINQTVNSIILALQAANTNITNLINNSNKENWIGVNISQLNRQITNTMRNLIGDIKGSVSNISRTIHSIELPNGVKKSLVKIEQQINRTLENMHISQLFNTTGIDSNKINQTINSIIHSLEVVRTNSTQLLKRLINENGTRRSIDQIKQKLSSAIDNLISDVREIITNISRSITEIPNEIKKNRAQIEMQVNKTIGNISQLINNTAMNMCHIKEEINQTIHRIGEAVKGTKTNITQLLDSVKNVNGTGIPFKQFSRQIYNTVMNLLVDAKDSISNVYKIINSKTTKEIQVNLQAVNKTLSKISDNLNNSELMDNIKRDVNQLHQLANQTIDSILSDLRKVTDLVDSFSNGNITAGISFDHAYQFINNSVTNLIDYAKLTIDNIAKKIKNDSGIYINNIMNLYEDPEQFFNNTNAFIKSEVNLPQLELQINKTNHKLINDVSKLANTISNVTGIDVEQIPKNVNETVSNIVKEENSLNVDLTSIIEAEKNKFDHVNQQINQIIQNRLEIANTSGVLKDTEHNLEQLSQQIIETNQNIVDGVFSEIDNTTLLIANTTGIHKNIGNESFINWLYNRNVLRDAEQTVNTTENNLQHGIQFIRNQFKEITERLNSTVLDFQQRVRPLNEFVKHIIQNSEILNNNISKDFKTTIDDLVIYLNDTINHEIQNPLNITAIFTQLIQMGDLNQDIDILKKLLRQSTNSVETLIRNGTSEIPKLGRNVENETDSAINITSTRIMNDLNAFFNQSQGIIDKDGNDANKLLSDLVKGLNKYEVNLTNIIMRMQNYIVDIFMKNANNIESLLLNGTDMESRVAGRVANVWMKILYQMTNFDEVDDTTNSNDSLR